MNVQEEEKPPSLPDSKGSRCPAWDSRVNPCDLYWLPVWRAGNITGLAIHGDIGNYSLRKHKAVDLVFGKNDQEERIDKWQFQVIQKI